MIYVLLKGAFVIAKPAHTNKMSVCMGMSLFHDENHEIKLKLGQEPCLCQLFSNLELGT